MVKKRREIENLISRFAHNLRAMGIDVYKIFLYGSYAKGRPKEYSDIDVAVVSPSFRKLDIFERQELLSLKRGQSMNLGILFHFVRSRS